ncbi:hypothetical protein [Acinetobacter bouvetii]|nr:hypothetical protein [Acinetobacter bouvetii]
MLQSKRLDMSAGNFTGLDAGSAAQIKSGMCICNGAAPYTALASERHG